MTTKQVLEQIRKVIREHTGLEKELLEELCAEAEGWEMRLVELEQKEDE